MTSLPTHPSDRKRRRWILPAAFVGTAAVGFGIGSTTQPEPEIVTETVVETETITEEVEVIVTEEVEVAVTPVSCISAIDAADEVMDLLLEGWDASSDALLASASFDVAAIDAATVRIENLTQPLADAGFDWGFYSESCKEAAE